MGERIFIVDAKRSPIGKFQGKLKNVDIMDVSAQVVREGFDSKLIKQVEKVIIGNVFSAGLGQGMARNIALTVGCRQDTPAYSLNMVCGSSMQALLNGVFELKNGMELVLIGGVESMSNIPYAVSGKVRDGIKFGNIVLTDLMLNDGLVDQFSGLHMGVTAENIAQKYRISREEQDEYALRSIRKTVKAIEDGVFREEIVPVIFCDRRKNEYIFTDDENPNTSSSLEKLAKLKPSFESDAVGTVTAGNSSALNDGACFMLLGTESFCRRNHLTPLAEIVDGTTVGCNPQLMGLGPFYAVSKLLERVGMDLSEIDYFELNEAFAAQAIGSIRLLAEKYGTTPEAIYDRCNMYGSGIGLGHPLGMTGARITTTLSHIMKRHRMKYGIASLCIGGGMGAAVLLKGVDENEAF